MRNLGRVDPGAYLHAFGLLARNPALILAPLLAGIVSIFARKLFPGEGGGVLGSLNSGLASLLLQLLGSFALAVSIILADLAWRRRAAFSEALEQARRRAGDILLAAVGFSFVLYVAMMIGAFVPGGAILMFVLGTFFFLYALPAAAIGGIPGGGALQISLERARGGILPTAAVTLLYLYVTLFLPAEAARLFFGPLLLGGSPDPGDVAALGGALCSAIASGYLALVLAKTYADLSYGRRY